MKKPLEETSLDANRFRAAVEQFKDYIARETLAVSIGFEPFEGVEPVLVNINGHKIWLYVKVVKTSSG